MHIGSQLTSIAPFIEAVEKVIAAGDCSSRSTTASSSGPSAAASASFTRIRSNPAASTGGKTSPSDERPLTIERYGKELVPRLKDLGLKILLEPGRFIVGNAGVLLTRCLYEKKGSAKTFKIVDAGMNDLIRPALYEGHHEIVPLTKPATERSRQGRCRRPDLRERRLLLPGPRAAGFPARRSRRADVRRGLRLRHGLELQLAPAAGGNSRRRRDRHRHPQAPDAGGFDRGRALIPIKHTNPIQKWLEIFLLVEGPRPNSTIRFQDRDFTVSTSA